MPESDRIRWNRKHRGTQPGKVLPALESLQDRLPRSGCVLDLACGTGANSLFLARLGLKVHAVDLSEVGLHILAEDARTHGLDHAISPVLLDLEEDGLRPNHDVYDLVMVVSFFHRPLFSLLSGWIRPGGNLLFETFHQGHLKVKPQFRKEWLLKRGEIATLFPDLEILEHHETETRAFLLAKRPER